MIIAELTPLIFASELYNGLSGSVAISSLINTPIPENGLFESV